VGAASGDKMDLRCPTCNSTDLKKVSLAHEEGLVRSNSLTRIQGVLVGSGGPNIIVGSAATKGTRQTALSRRLSPPRKWSCLKLLIWFVALSFVALVIYVHVVMVTSSISSSFPVKLYSLITPLTFVLLAFLTWMRNHFIYARQKADWGRSFVCQRCGAVSQHESRVRNIS